MRSGAVCGMRPSGKQVRPISALPFPWLFPTACIYKLSLRVLARLPAGVDGAFLRQIATDEKLCMFELLLTRLQARRLAAAVLARDGSGAIPQVKILKNTLHIDIHVVNSLGH